MESNVSAILAAYFHFRKCCNLIQRKKSSSWELPFQQCTKCKFCLYFIHFSHANLCWSTFGRVINSNKWDFRIVYKWELSWWRCNQHTQSGSVFVSGYCFAVKSKTRLHCHQQRFIHHKLKSKWMNSAENQSSSHGIRMGQPLKVCSNYNWYPTE